MSKSRKYPWRLAVVTGAAGGIGTAYCRRLAADGCRVVMVDRKPMTLPQAGVRHLALQLDLAQPAAAQQLMQWLDDHHLQPDLLINNAGIFDFASVEHLTPERREQYLWLHIHTLTDLTRLMALRMAAAGGGNILNMGSLSCWMPMPGVATYAATKAYVRVFSRAYGVEMRPHSVYITVACPGGIATDLYGLTPQLQRLGVRLGILSSPSAFTRGALRATRRRRAQYINGFFNRLLVPLTALTPPPLRRYINSHLLPRFGNNPQ